MRIPSIRRIFASFRTEEEERSYSRKAFFNLLGFLASCVIFSFVAQKMARQSREIAHLATANTLVSTIGR